MIDEIFEEKNEFKACFLKNSGVFSKFCIQKGKFLTLSWVFAWNFQFSKFRVCGSSVFWNFMAKFQNFLTLSRRFFGKSKKTPTVQNSAFLLVYMYKMAILVQKNKIKIDLNSPNWFQNRYSKFDIIFSRKRNFPIIKPFPRNFKIPIGNSEPCLFE
jgi:hypothetical protein